MDKAKSLKEILERVATAELWCELAKRLGIKFGKIQMAIHDGRPSKYATIDMRVCTDGASEQDEHSK